MRPDLILEQVQRTLQGGPPASAADLTALTIDVPEELSGLIRNWATSDWRQYWHRDRESGQSIKPCRENDFCDVLLSDQRLMLRKYQIDAQPEGRYADNNRANIRVSYRSDVAIPIEIKKNEHRGIWSGISG